MQREKMGYITTVGYIEIVMRNKFAFTRGFFIS